MPVDSTDPYDEPAPPPVFTVVAAEGRPTAVRLSRRRGPAVSAVPPIAAVAAADASLCTDELSSLSSSLPARGDAP